MMEVPMEITTKAGRKVKLTEKMRQFLKDVDKGETAQLRKGLLQALQGIQVKLKDPNVKVEEIQPQYQKTIADYTDFLDKEETEVKELAEDEKVEYHSYYEDDTILLRTVNEEVKNFLAQEAVVPKDSASHTSRNSRTSSRQSKVSVQVSAELQKQAELEERRLAMLKRAEIEIERRNLEEKTRQLNEKEELLSIETEINVSKAKVKIIESAEEDVVSRISSLGVNRQENRNPLNRAPKSPTKVVTETRQEPDKTVLSDNKAEQGYQPPRFESTPFYSRQRDAEVLDSLFREQQDYGLERAFSRMAEALERNQRNTLQIEPEVFKGEILNYALWKKSFEELVENDVRPNRRMIYLLKYTSGHAKECISSLAGLSSSEAYVEAMKMLDERYGDPFSTYEAYRRKLDAWPTIRESDGIGLRRYADFLGSCLAAMTQISYLQVLDDASENQKLLKKLPRRIVERWSQRVDDWLYKNEREVNTAQIYPPFFVFVDFVKRAARVECGPVKRSLAERVDHRKSGKAVRALLTEVEEEVSEENATCNVTMAGQSQEKGTTGKGQSCLKCSGRHQLSSCQDFGRMPMVEKQQFARVHRICRGCLEVGHLARRCINFEKCKTCKGNHNTLFHDENYKPRERNRPERKSEQKSEDKTEQSVVNCTSVGSKGEASLIMPVFLHQKGKPEHEVMVYALLDPQANSCFVSQSTKERIQAQGQLVDLELTTMSGTEVVSADKFQDLILQDEKRLICVELPRTYSRERIAADHSQIPDPECVRRWRHLSEVADRMSPVKPNVDIGLLIGTSCSRLLKPRDCIPGEENEPYAVRTELGWGVIGSLHADLPSKKSCTWAYRTQVKELNPSQVLSMFAMDFHERPSEEKVSVEDKRFLKQLEEATRLTDDGHLEMPLPFKHRGQMPNNKKQAAGLLYKLKNRLTKDERYRTHYVAFMRNLIEKGYAEKVTEPGREGQVWYLPHHGVYHPKKPDKIRIVFNCSIEYCGEVLNRYLMQGPDLINSLIGVLCRFRRGPVAVTCGIEAMYHQVKVRKDDRDYLRFLWWEEDDLTKPPIEYRMTVHLFGATSSPGCANFALKKVADLYEEKYGSEAADFIRHDFYVDDGLRSVRLVSEAQLLVEKSRLLCQEGGFNLHKFLSNKKAVLEAIPVEIRAKGVQELDLKMEELPVERTLGVLWCAETDTFQFRVQLQEKPITRRGTLSTVSSIYDPLGLVSPVIMIGKRILKNICLKKCDWDEPLDEETELRWNQWKQDVMHLGRLKIPRCYMTENMGRNVEAELHHFSDASVTGYGQCSYLRLKDQFGHVETSLVMAKSRVTPAKFVTIPRLELTAAVTSVRVAEFLKKEFKDESISQHFWTDSKVVLGYINNETRRFNIFVANRVQVIREHTTCDMWLHVDTQSNPADLASRGVPAQELINNELWFKGPSFLRSGEPLPQPSFPELDESDPEIKRTTALATQVQLTWSSELLERLSRFSSWRVARNSVAVLLRLKKSLKERKAKVWSEERRPYVPVRVDEVMNAEAVIFRAAQTVAFPEEKDILLEEKCEGHGRQPQDKEVRMLRKKSRLNRLDAFMDGTGLMRVGGRIRRANLPIQDLHPVILPKTGHVTELVVRHFHERVAHGGRGATLNAVRAYGIWLLSGRSAVSRYIWDCVSCRRYRGPTLKQKMADLPQDRLNQLLLSHIVE